MGIKGLLQAVKPLMKTSHVSEYRGKRVAIDGYCWLHKAVYGCCVELCNGQKSQAWISYCLSFLDMLLRNGVLVTMVFDGASLPMKALTEADRESNRQTNLQRAQELMRNGDKDAARNFFARAIDITPAMAAELIQVIRQTRPGVDCIVAPYEADAQLAYLSANNLVDSIVTEDSDTIPYGCKDVIFKLERDGTCQRLILKDIYSEAIDKFDLRSFNEEMVLTMCILSGCDYLDSVKGMGLKTSYKYVAKQRTTASVLKALRLAGQLPIVPANNPSENNPNATNVLAQLLQYELDFYQAILTFLHQVVYDPVLRKSVYRTPLQRDLFPSQLLEIWWPQAQDAPSLPFLGSLLDDDIAQGIADGLLDPTTKQPFQLQSTLSSSSTAVASSSRILGHGNGAVSVRSAPPHSTRALSSTHFMSTFNATTTNTTPYQSKQQQQLKASSHTPVSVADMSTPSPSFTNASKPYVSSLTKSATISASLSSHSKFFHHRPPLHPSAPNSAPAAPLALAAGAAAAVTAPMMKTYFASSSLKRYESTSSLTNSARAAVTSITTSDSSNNNPTTSIASYFKAANNHSKQSSTNTVIHSTSSSITKKTSIFDRFKANKSITQTAEGCSTAYSHQQIHQQKVVEEAAEATIDLSIDSSDEDEANQKVHSNNPMNTTGRSSSLLQNNSSLDIYDISSITPEKILASTQEESTVHRHSSMYVPTGSKHQVAPMSNISSTSVIKSDKGHCISKFFSKKASPSQLKSDTASSFSSQRSDATATSTTLTNSSDIQRFRPHQVEYVEPSPLVVDDSEKIVAKDTRRDTKEADYDSNSVEQLADRLLGPEAHSSTTADVGIPSPLTAPVKSHQQYTKDDEGGGMDWYDSTVNQDSQPLDHQYSTDNSNPSDSKSLVREARTDETVEHHFPTKMTVKRPSFVAFSAAETSIARLQRQRIGEAQDALNLRQLHGGNTDGDECQIFASAVAEGSSDSSSGYKIAEESSGGYEATLTLSPPLTNHAAKSLVDNSSKYENGGNINKVTQLTNDSTSVSAKTQRKNLFARFALQS